MIKPDSVQASFLNNLRKNRTVIHVHLVNEKRLQSRVKAFDNFVILLKMGNSLYMLYKQTISTVLPEPAMSAHKRWSSSETVAASKHNQVAEDVVSSDHTSFRG